MPAHHPPGATPAQHARAPQTPHTHPPACARNKPPCPHTTVCPQVPPTTSHRVPPLCMPTATTDGPTRQPKPLGLPASRKPPHLLPSLRGPQPPPPRAARSPSRTPPRQPPQLLPATHRRPAGPPSRVLRHGRSGPSVEDSHGHGQRTPAPPQPAPAPQRGRLERGGLPQPSRLYLDHHDLDPPDLQLPALREAAPAPEAWAETAPEEIADYLQIACRRFNTALGRQKGTPYPLGALLYPAQPSTPHS